MDVYLRAKFEVPSIILTGFRQREGEGNLPPSSTSKRIPKKPIQIRVKDLKAFIEYPNDICNVYKNINHYNSDKENIILIVFDNLIADMIQNKKLNSINTELFIRGRKLNVSLVFITQSYFKVPKDARLNTTHFFIAKISNKTELQQIAINHSSDISTEDFVNIYS